MRNLTMLLCVGTLLLGGCATQYQKRGTEEPLEETEQASLANFELEGSDPGNLDRPHQLDIEARSIERFSKPEFTVGVIELTDDGEINPAQHRQVMKEVREKLDDEKGALLIVFVHGWHHGCRTCDSNLACFRRALHKLSSDELALGGRGRNVIGVYLGWRGRSILQGPLPVDPDFLSIWNRKRAAEHIGRTGGKEILAELNDEWLQRKGKVTMVTVGHSLGGALVFSAVKGQLSGNAADILIGKDDTHRIVRTQTARSTAKAGKKAIRSRFGDLVVLVNPAIEASQYAPFDADLHDDRPRRSQKELPPDRGRAYDDHQLPVLMTIASTADKSVGQWFPIARKLSALNIFKNGKIFTSRAKSIGMGRYKPHFTHTLRRNGTPIPVLDEEKRREAKQCGCAIWREPSYSVDDAYLSLTSLGLEDQGTRGENDFQFDHVEDRRPECNGSHCKGWDEHTPYLVISADKTIIGGHNDIFNPVFTGFLRKFLAAFEKEKWRDSSEVY